MRQREMKKISAGLVCLGVLFMIQSFQVQLSVGFNGVASVVGRILQKDPTFTIYLVTNARGPDDLQELQTLCNSLIEADYADHEDVNLQIYLDASASDEVADYVNDLNWANGPKSVTLNSMAENPEILVGMDLTLTSNRDHAIIFNDETEKVSPYFFVWLETMLKAYHKNPDQRIAGISLFSPHNLQHMAAENAGMFIDTTEIKECIYEQRGVLTTTGTLWLPGPWNEFLDYRSEKMKDEPKAKAADWKQYMTENMNMKNQYLVYPNFPHHLSMVSFRDTDSDTSEGAHPVTLFEEGAFGMLKDEFGMDDPLGCVPERLHGLTKVDIQGVPLKPITIIALQTDPMHYWCTCARGAAEEYSSKYGYKLHWITESAHAGDVIASKFQKYEEVLNHLDESELVVTFDCDLMITNQDITVESVWDKWAKQTTNMIVARDAHFRIGYPINSGMIIWKPSEFVNFILNKVLKEGRLTHVNKYGSHVLVDQPRLTYELEMLKQLEGKPKDELEEHDYVTIVSQRVMNAFYRFNRSDPPDSKWRSGDWVAHITGMSASKRRDVADLLHDGCPGIIDETADVVMTTDGIVKQLRWLVRNVLNY